MTSCIYLFIHLCGVIKSFIAIISKAVNISRLTLYLVSFGGPDGLTEELDTDGWQEADAHRQDDGEPQVRLAKCISGNTCGGKESIVHHVVY